MSDRREPDRALIRIVDPGYLEDVMAVRVKHKWVYQRPFNDWNYDYCVEKGASASCPHCGSSDVDFDHKETSGSGLTRVNCNACDAFSMWSGYLVT